MSQDIEKILTNPYPLKSIINQIGAQSGMDLTSETLTIQYKHNHQGKTSDRYAKDSLTDKNGSRDNLITIVRKDVSTFS